MSDADSLQPGFMVVHGNRLETLRQLMVDWMREHPLGPLENEVILVQSNGIAQWLQMALAADPEQGGAGIAAALDVQLPARFLWDSYRGVLGRSAVPEQSPLDKQPLLWRLMRLLPELLEKDVFAPLHRFLADDPDCRKRYQLAERLADLFDQYQVYRADWLNDWAAGENRIGLAREGYRTLGSEEQWQPALWRAVLEDVGIDRLDDSRAGIHPRFVEQMLTTTERPAQLPRRVIVFGISSLPAQTLEALAVIGRYSQVLLGVLNPCQFHWGDIVADQDLLRHQYRRQQRRPGAPLQLDDSNVHQHAHPLLAAWGKQGRDYINLLDQHDERAGYEARFAQISGGRVDLFEEPRHTHLLAQLQSDILALRPLQETREQWPPLDLQQDRSVRFHVAHSAQREVEVLHDQLLDAFAADPSLKPRDIIVMVPDVDTYAPHIQAVFGQYAADDARAIPFTLADQGQRGREPLLIALEHLLDLPNSRLPVSEVFDLLDVPALRNRFSVTEQELPLLHRWIEGAGIRWGLDQQRRQALGLPPDLDANSWRFGLRRMLLGYASGSAAWGDIEPYAEVGGLDAALLGPLSQLLERLDQHERQLREPAVPQVWGERLRQLLDDFFTAESASDQVLLVQLQESLADWLELCDSVALETSLPLNVVAEAWLDSLSQAQLSQRFLAGAVNVCTLMPMRAIPFKRVCLLGMNDGDYPRAHPPLDFDLMGQDYRPGDRSRREDDRYLLLEALLSARDGLYISWVGRSIRDNSERPPSVLIGQLRDHLAAGWQMLDGTDLLPALTTEHPLQPFSRAYFAADSELFSYAREWHALHDSPPDQQNNHPLAAQPVEDTLELVNLQRFLRQPVEHFFNARLKVWLQEQEKGAEDDEPFTLDGLQRHQLSQWLLERVQQAPLDADWDALLLVEAERLQQRGELPLAGFAALTREQLLGPLHNQLARYREQALLWDQVLTHPVALNVSIDEVTVVHWLAGVRQSDHHDGFVRLQLLTGNGLAGKGKTKQPRWRRLLNELSLHVLAAASGQPLTTQLICADASVQLHPLNQSHAKDMLEKWMLGWHQGLRRPLPVAMETACAFLLEPVSEQQLAKARACYEGSQYTKGERDKSVALQRSYPDFADMLVDEEFAGWAESLYQPLLDAQDEGWLTFDLAGEDGE